MTIFWSSKKRLLNEKQSFEKAVMDYNQDSSVRKEFLTAFENFVNALREYEKELSKLTSEQVLEEYRDALKFLDIANREYDPFIAKGPLMPGENPPAIPFNELEAASDKLRAAEEWLDAIRRALAKVR